jgi:hypothetical protein
MGEPILDPGRQAGMCVYNGAEWRKAKGDADGHAQVDVLSSALPTGAATETTLSAINTELAQKLETADLAIDTDKHLDTHKIPHSSYVKCYETWRVTVPAGGTYVFLDTTAGCGRVLSFYLRVDGASADVRFSRIQFFVDGETSPSSKFYPAAIYTYLGGRRIVDLSIGGTITWDTTNFIYEVWLGYGPAFESSLKITLYNYDTTNPADFRVGVWVEFLK